MSKYEKRMEELVLTTIQKQINTGVLPSEAKDNPIFIDNVCHKAIWLAHESPFGSNDSLESRLDAIKNAIHDNAPDLKWNSIVEDLKPIHYCAPISLLKRNGFTEMKKVGFGGSTSQVRNLLIYGITSPNARDSYDYDFNYSVLSREDGGLTVPFEDHAMLYQNPTTKERAFVYLPYLNHFQHSQGVDQIRTIETWCANRGLFVEIHATSWYNQTSLVIISLEPVDFIERVLCYA